MFHVSFLTNRIKVCFSLVNWIMSSNSSWSADEDQSSKLMKKAKESPFVPIGKLHTNTPAAVMMLVMFMCTIIDVKSPV